MLQITGQTRGSAEVVASNGTWTFKPMQLRDSPSAIREPRPTKSKIVPQRSARFMLQTRGSASVVASNGKWTFKRARLCDSL